MISHPASFNSSNQPKVKLRMSSLLQRLAALNAVAHPELPCSVVGGGVCVCVLVCVCVSLHLCLMSLCTDPLHVCCATALTCW